MYTTKQGNRVNCLALTGFTAFGKWGQLSPRPPYAETEEVSWQASLCGVLAAGW